MNKDSEKNIVRCAKGKHYYDANRYESCPWCEKANKGTSPTMPLVHQKKEDAKRIARTKELNNEPEILENEPKLSVAEPEEDGTRLRITELEEKTNLMEKIESAQQSGSQGVSNDDVRTRGAYDTRNGVEPTVGLLLCIEGADFGSTYLLKSGNNYVGRSNAMDVVIMGDDGVSRNKHAVIMYDPKGKTYMALPGEARELYYVNDQVVVAPQVIKYHDIISIGNTKLMFVPICGEDFSWDDYEVVK